MQNNPASFSSPRRRERLLNLAEHRLAPGSVVPSPPATSPREVVAALNFPQLSPADLNTPTPHTP